MTRQRRHTIHSKSVRYEGRTEHFQPQLCLPSPLNIRKFLIMFCCITLWAIDKKLCVNTAACRHSNDQIRDPFKEIRRFNFDTASFISFIWRENIQTTKNNNILILLGTERLQTQIGRLRLHLQTIHLTTRQPVAISTPHLLSNTMRRSPADSKEAFLQQCALQRLTAQRVVAIPYQRFGTTYRSHLTVVPSIWDPQDVPKRR